MTHRVSKPYCILATASLLAFSNYSLPTMSVISSLFSLCSHKGQFAGFSPSSATILPSVVLLTSAYKQTMQNLCLHVRTIASSSLIPLPQSGWSQVLSEAVLGSVEFALYGCTSCISYNKSI